MFEAMHTYLVQCSSATDAPIGAAKRTRQENLTP